MSVNSSFSTESSVDYFDGWTFSDEYINIGLEYAFLVMAAVGSIGNVFLLMVTRYMVHEMKRAGLISFWNFSFYKQFHYF